MTIRAHSVICGRDEYALSILFDGRTSADSGSALVLQSAIDEFDGAEIYAEIPIQRFATNTGIVRAEIAGNSLRILFADPLNGEWEYLILIPAECRDRLLTGLNELFARQPETLTVRNAN